MSFIHGHNLCQLLVELGFEASVFCLFDDLGHISKKLRTTLCYVSCLCAFSLTIFLPTYPKPSEVCIVIVNLQMKKLKLKLKLKIILLRGEFWYDICQLGSLCTFNINTRDKVLKISLS